MYSMLLNFEIIKCPCLLTMFEYPKYPSSCHEQFNKMNDGLARLWQETRLLSLLQLGDNGPVG